MFGSNTLITMVLFTKKEEKNIAEICAMNVREFIRVLIMFEDQNTIGRHLFRFYHDQHGFMIEFLCVASALDRT